MIEIYEIIKNRFKKIIDSLLPDDEETGGNLPNGEVGLRQQVLNKLKEHFLTEMANETTTESLLFHTSFTVYVSEEGYKLLSPSFPFTAKDATGVFEKLVRKALKKYPNYDKENPHSRCWEMQLNAIPEGAEIEGVNAELLDDNFIIIQSKLFADNNTNDARIQDDVHCKTTIYTKDSSKGLPNALNFAAIVGLIQLAKDNYSKEINLSGEAANEDERPKAILHLVDGGNFIDQYERTYRVYNMTGDKLFVSGKNGPASNNTIHINDETVLNPTLEIQRNKNTGLFTLKAWGDVQLGGRRVVSGNAVPLPTNSYIVINERYQIDFKINR